MYLKKRAWLKYAKYVNGKRGLKAVPINLGVCLTHLCNIKCPYCMRENFQPPEGPMTLSKIQVLMKKMSYISGVCIMGLCEPFLNRETSNIIRWLKDKGGYNLSFTTNGTVDLNEDRLDALLRVDDFVFSIDSYDPYTFKILRGGADLKRVMNNMDQLIQFKREHKLGKDDKPPIHINSVITPLNFDHIPGLIKMLEPYSEDLTYLMVDPVSRPDYSKYDPMRLHSGQFKDALVEYKKIAKSSSLKVLGLDYMFEESTNWTNCPLTWESMFIEPNGDAYFCYNYEYILGNVFQDDPLKVWNNQKARDFRKRLLSYDPPLVQCRSCNFARSGWQVGGAYSKKKEDQTY